MSPHKNPEAARAYWRAYRKRNQEKIRKQHTARAKCRRQEPQFRADSARRTREWYWRNPEKARAINRAHGKKRRQSAEVREINAAACRKRYRLNREAYYAASRNYLRRHPEKRREYQQRYASKNRDAINHKGRIKARAMNLELRPHIVRGHLRRMGFDRSAITSELIEAKRLQILIKRRTTQKKE